jgi:hypothetical protein
MRILVLENPGYWPITPSAGVIPIPVAMRIKWEYSCATLPKKEIENADENYKRGNIVIK